MVPSLVRALRPELLLTKLFVNWTVITAQQLRLSSFLLGVRAPAEEGVHVRKTWKALLKLKCAPVPNRRPSKKSEPANADVVWKPNGHLARVPALDAIKLVPGQPSTVHVNRDGTAFTEAGARIIAAQRAAGASEADYEIVYLPPHFRIRLVLAFYLLWVSGSAWAISLCVGPRTRFSSRLYFAHSAI